MPLTVPQFVAKWKAASLSERSSYQQHFLDLCALLDVTPPAEADPTGASFTFEKGVAKADGGKLLGGDRGSTQDEKRFFQGHADRTVRLVEQ